MKKAIIAACLASAVCTIPATHAATEQSRSSTAVLLQGFHWHSANGSWYADLQSRAVDLKTLGVTHVWFPPPSDAGSTEGYLPRQLNVLNSAYGPEAALTAAISALNGQGIRSVADVVINHRVGTSNWADFTNPTWDCRSVVNNDEWSGRCGNADSGDSYGAARDIDHSQSFVQNDIKTWLSTRLRNAGFSGIRYDYSKGYAPSYAKIYHDAMAPDFCVGEVWTDLNYANVDPHRQLLMNYVDGTAGTCGAFDFTTKGLLNQALAYNEYYRLRDATGAPAGGIGWWGQKMVTFVDNHDTGPSESCSSGQNHWPIPCDKVMQGYAYILTHPGIPSVYYAHVYNWGLKDAIKALITVRRNAGLTSTSTVAIQQASSGLYAAIIGGKVAMKIGPTDWNPGSGWTLATSGSNYAVWTSGVVSGDTTAPSSPASLTPGTVATTTVALSWPGASDNVAVTGYNVYRNGTPVGSATATSYTDTSARSNSTYSYTVKAKDKSGNLSAASPSKSVTTAGSSCNVNVTFSINNANTVYGQNLYVVGNQPTLGNWTVSKGFKLTIQGSGANATWLGRVSIPAGKPVQYKYVKYNPSTGQTIWELDQLTTSKNREFSSSTTCNASQTRADGSFKK